VRLLENLLNPRPLLPGKFGVSGWFPELHLPNPLPVRGPFPAGPVLSNPGITLLIFIIKHDIIEISY
jgi:hypothetical protein